MPSRCVAAFRARMPSRCIAASQAEPSSNPPPSSPTIRLARRPLGPKPEAIWEEQAVGEMIQGSPWLRIPVSRPHPELRGNATSG
ncbi:unnamed protein product [Rangifer tarandus platyrhynchus]|uniref:Uncharacterized protein n=1 Tax=Rangifer tarandus platyrhynchus TaxID=3082113 RepID=A0AC60A5J5_RANTA